MTAAEAPAESPAAGPLAGLRDTAEAARLVFANPGLRRVNLALAGSMVGDWAFATAVTVVAFRYGGPAAVGVYAAARLGLMAAFLPFTAIFVDRLPRRALMVGLDLARTALVLAATVLLWTGGPAVAVLVLAVVAGVVGAPFRPAQGALLPDLARTPHELTAANAVASTLESLSFFVGPALAGVLLTVSGPTVVFALNAATFVWSALLIARLDVRPAPRSAPEASEPFLREVAAGFVTVGRERRLRLIVLLTCAQSLMAGALRVFAVVVAVELVHLGAQGVGFLEAVLGVGAVVGGLVAIARSSGTSVARDFGAGVLLWALPALAVAIWPSAAVVYVAFAVIGLANPIVDVNLMTVLQRIAPEAVLGRVFGALETSCIAAMALGALVVPPLLDGVGLRWTLVVCALPVAVVAVAAFASLRRVDAELTAPPGVELVRRQPIFALLAPAAQEDLARRLAGLSVPAGTEVVRRGDPGDRFFLVESGRLAARRDETTLSEMTAGDCFGEIALLRDVPRTATVVALTDVELQTLEREDFLAALRDSPEASGAVDLLVNVRLAR